MTAHNSPATASTSSPSLSALLPAWPFVLTVGWGAFILFQLQPVLAKPLLPTLGGVPMVWMGCMMVFQFLLLVGYAYAFWLSARPAAWQWRLHVGMWALVVLSLCFPLPEIFHFDPATQPLGWLIENLLRHIGLPFVTLAATTPLVQRWALMHRPEMGARAFRLYVASNLGSFAGLLSYPFIIEPWLTLSEQWQWLVVGFTLQAIFIAWAAFSCWRAVRQQGARAVATALPEHEEAPAPSARAYGTWILYSALGCSLMLGTTHHLSMDIASIPLLWVVPLALYLLSFTVAFGRFSHVLKPIEKPIVLLVAIMLVMTLVVGGSGYMLLQLIVWLAGLFLLCCIVHGWLAEAQPAPSRASGYYLAIAFGGVTAGVFNGVLAPVIFDQVIEHIVSILLLVVVAAWRITPRPWRDTQQWRVVLAMLLLPIAIAVAIRSGLVVQEEAMKAGLYLCVFFSAGIYLRKPEWRWVQLVILFAILQFQTQSQYIQEGRPLLLERSWFGVTRVDEKQNGALHMLVHGNTVHGVQLRTEGQQREVLSYYAPLKRLWAGLPAEVKEQPFGIVGLGAGTLACLDGGPHAMDLFEIDDVMVRIAQDPNYFSYLQECAQNAPIYLGDGRLALEKVENQRYGLLVLDAFSSDSVPVHLVTKEALELYLNKLQPNGVLAYNVSNRYLNMVPVLGSLAKDAGLYGYSLQFTPPKTAQEDTLFQSQWVFLSRNPLPLDTLTGPGIEVEVLKDAGKDYLWRDDYSALWRVVK